MKKILAKQRQEGFFSIRLKSAAGKLTAAQLLAVHEMAEKFGAGFINLTSRQEISVPFVKEEDLDTIEKFCAEHKLKISPLGTIFKQVTACQGTQSCPAGIIDSPKIACEFEERYGGRELPNKITCAVTGCPNNCMKVDANDIGVKGAVEPQFVSENCIYCGVCQNICPVGAIFIGRNQKIWTINRDKCINCGRCVKVCRKAALRGEVGYKIYFAGKDFLPLVHDEETLYKIVDAALKYFSEHAKSRERLSKMFERLGEDDFKKETLYKIVDAVLKCFSEPNPANV